MPSKSYLNLESVIAALPLVLTVWGTGRLISWYLKPLQTEHESSRTSTEEESSSSNCTSNVESSYLQMLSPKEIITIAVDATPERGGGVLHLPLQKMVVFYSIDWTHVFNFTSEHELDQINMVNLIAALQIFQEFVAPYRKLYGKDALIVKSNTNLLLDGGFSYYSQRNFNMCKLFYKINVDLEEAPYQGNWKYCVKHRDVYLTLAEKLSQSDHSRANILPAIRFGDVFYPLPCPQPDYRHINVSGKRWQGFLALEIYSSNQREILTDDVRNTCNDLVKKQNDGSSSPPPATSATTSTSSVKSKPNYSTPTSDDQSKTNATAKPPPNDKSNSSTPLSKSSETCMVGIQTSSSSTSFKTTSNLSTTSSSYCDHGGSPLSARQPQSRLHPTNTIAIAVDATPTQGGGCLILPLQNLVYFYSINWSEFFNFSSGADKFEMVNAMIALDIFEEFLEPLREFYGYEINALTLKCDNSFCQNRDSSYSKQRNSDWRKLFEKIDSKLTKAPYDGDWDYCSKQTDAYLCMADRLSRSDHSRSPKLPGIIFNGVHYSTLHSEFHHINLSEKKTCQSITNAFLELYYLNLHGIFTEKFKLLLKIKDILPEEDNATTTASPLSSGPLPTTVGPNSSPLAAPYNNTTLSSSITTSSSPVYQNSQKDAQILKTDAFSASTDVIIIVVAATKSRGGGLLVLPKQKRVYFYSADWTDSFTFRTMSYRCEIVNYILAIEFFKEFVSDFREACDTFWGVVIKTDQPFCQYPHEVDSQGNDSKWRHLFLDVHSRLYSEPFEGHWNYTCQEEDVCLRIAKKLSSTDHSLSSGLPKVGSHHPYLSFARLGYECVNVSKNKERPVSDALKRMKSKGLI